ncbi:MAG: hypothetical protein DMG04_15835 [Acidobacteria bacterium]|nr:MAG: hypothetical protein DMG04_15835 [Acidobacteriota bacterium]PYQ80986.1 MAG: hypothetical protein DMG03_21110 [Acidobacteriota bacterium]PYQ87878.1 MAG: hypothetical protein DMG02_19750 [Acidobacteriota bacterium]PYR09476.1 MAG: hypothetical protein DMF99_15315 [Acidobacteriota bacterium]
MQVEILRKLSEGASEADLINAYSQLTGEDIHAAMRFAADTIAHEEVVFIGKKDADTNRDYGVRAPPRTRPAVHSAGMTSVPTK